MPYCVECGAQHSDLAHACPQCGRPTGLRQLVAQDDDDPTLRWLVPVGRTPLAIIAGYVGLFGLGIVFIAPIAIVLGIIAALQIKRRPGRHGMGRAVFAIVAGVCSIVGWATLVAVM
jgi:hypothetical protein